MCPQCLGREQGGRLHQPLSKGTPPILTHMHQPIPPAAIHGSGGMNLGTSSAQPAGLEMPSLLWVPVPLEKRLFNTWMGIPSTRPLSAPHLCYLEPKGSRQVGNPILSSKIQRLCSLGPPGITPTLARCRTGCGGAWPASRPGWKEETVQSRLR